jgi:hypothetical protein
MVKNVENRTKDFDEAYTTWRNGLKDEWQQAARKRTASGDLFQNQPSTKKFAQKIDAMSAKYANDPAVVRQLDSLKRMVMGDQGKLPSFDAIETAQQKIVAQAKDPSTAAVPNMVLDYHAVADSLNNAMAEYAPQYGQMIKAWPKVMEQKEALQKITTFTNKYAVELEKISPTSQANPRETLNASRSIIVKLKNDGFIDDATKSQYIKRIEDAETQYGQTDVAKKRASEATKAAMTLGASAIGAGAVGWWGYQIFGTHGKQ